MLRSLPFALCAICLTLPLAACRPGGDAAKTAAGADAASDAVLIGAEDIVTLHTGTLASGPVITGSVQPERRADLRAEVSAVVLQVLKENGENVKKGDLLVRLDDTAIRDSLTSSSEAERVAGQTREQTERQFQRMTRLLGSGLASRQELEDAEIRRNNAQSDLATAKARAVQARQQLQRTLVTAPFDGIVSERKVSAGDTAQIGKELVKVIDPASIRFEGLVSADKIDSVRVGQLVSFKVNGQGQQDFTGKVKRIDPAANSTTRQIEVLVEFEGKQPRVSGLYAEGTIAADNIQTLMIPEAALARSGDKTFAWRLKDGALNKVAVVIGARDPRSGDYAVRSGLADGDRLVRNPGTNLKDGRKVQLQAAVPAAPAPAKPTAAAPAASAAAVEGK